MPSIHLLSDHVINQIAAGEVIENPASVVKELVENALDAQASRIYVETKAGGFQLLCVSDNGSGMSAADALLSLERHATSKIVDTSDLLQLATMGFRGEALASIAAISHLTLITAKEGEGTCIEVEGGKVVRQGVYARHKGTSIEVRSLFYNVPARKKFQKSPAASSAEITRLLTALSLAHPNIGFELVHNETQNFSLPENSTLEERIRQILGNDFLAQLLPMQCSEPLLSCEGYVSSPLYNRPNRTGQYLFINHRFVFCPSIAYAVRDGYGMRLAEQRHPLFVLHLKIPSTLLDVNVHPQKREVRLREESLIKEKMKQMIRKALGENSSPSFTPLPSPTPFLLREEEFFSPSPFKEPLPFQKEMPLREERQALTVLGSYLLLKEEGKFLLVDLLAAQARIAFEEMTKKTRGDMAKQSLLFPLTIDLPMADLAIIETHLPLLAQLGLEVRILGKNTALIETLPPFMEEKEISTVFHKLIEELREGKEAKNEMATFFAQVARARKRSFMIQEAKELFEALMRTELPHHCPEGKLTMITLDVYEIQKLFAKETAEKIAGMGL